VLASSFEFTDCCHSSPPLTKVQGLAQEEQ
jgi:hypothetical protein